MFTFNQCLCEFGTRGVDEFNEQQISGALTRAPAPYQNPGLATRDSSCRILRRLASSRDVGCGVC